MGSGAIDCMYIVISSFLFAGVTGIQHCVIRIFHSIFLRYICSGNLKRWNCVSWILFYNQQISSHVF